jgi:hypothetical protein
MGLCVAVARDWSKEDRIDGANGFINELCSKSKSVASRSVWVN